jgi:hypothetical protein
VNTLSCILSFNGTLRILFKIKNQKLKIKNQKFRSQRSAVRSQK